MFANIQLGLHLCMTEYMGWYTGKQFSCLIITIRHMEFHIQKETGKRREHTLFEYRNINMFLPMHGVVEPRRSNCAF